MAKSSSFFGIRKGSTKSHTYQSYRGQQITKDRVTEVSNPQTTNQMWQRLKLPLVASAAAQLKGLVNHSFEGVEYGWKSIQEFRKQNLSGNNLVVASFVPKGASDCGEANLLVSKGSLTTLAVNTSDDDGQPFTITNNGGKPSAMQAADGQSTEAFVIQCLKEIYGLMDGDQISVLLQHGVQSYTFESDGSTVKGMRHGFILSRFILTEGSNTDWNLKVETGTITMNDGYQNWEIILSNSGTIAATMNVIIPTLDPTRYPEQESYLCGCAPILSRKIGNDWKRSTQRIVTRTGDHTVTYDQAYPTYLKNASNSLRFLNNGTDATSITGNSYRNTRVFGDRSAGK